MNNSYLGKRKRNTWAPEHLSKSSASLACLYSWCENRCEQPRCMRCGGWVTQQNYLRQHWSILCGKGWSCFYLFFLLCSRWEMSEAGRENLAVEESECDFFDSWFSSAGLWLHTSQHKLDTLLGNKTNRVVYKSPREQSTSLIIH